MKRNKVASKQEDQALAEKQRVQERADALGGWLMPGLYQQTRRVRAKLEWGKWTISADEQDLIAAIRTRTINSDESTYNLKNRYGLQIRKEIAPVEITTDQSGSTRIDRTDEWGEGAKPYIEPIKERLGFRDLTDVLVFLIFLPFWPANWVSDHISGRANLVVGYILLFGAMAFVSSVVGDDGVDSFQEFLWATVGAFFMFTAFIPFFKNS